MHNSVLIPPRNFDREKERKYESLDAAYADATKNLQLAETTFTNMKAQLKLKKEEVQGLYYPPFTCLG